MCGRYNLITDAQALVDAFQIIGTDLDLLGLEKLQAEIGGSEIKLYNISPSKPGEAFEKLHKAPIIRLRDDSLECLNAVWPLVPKWAKGIVPKYATANARAESLATANSYKYAWTHRQRCLVPATGFYEWQVEAEGAPKQPYNIQLKQQPIFAMAGLWEYSSDGNHAIESFTIVTTKANPLMARIHNTKFRMPVILSPALYKTWLSGSEKAAESCIQSYPDKQMSAYKISTRVNNPGFSEPECIKPL